MFEIIGVIALNTIGDAVRGGQLRYKPLGLSNGLWGALAFTMAMHLLLDFSWPVAASVLVAYLIGESFGWGSPLGAFLKREAMHADDLEWWQVGVLKRRADLALCVRGLMWGTPIAIALVVAGFTNLAVVTVLVYALAMLVSPYLVRRYFPKRSAWWMWQKQEWIRGFIVMAVLAILI